MLIREIQVLTTVDDAGPREAAYFWWLQTTIIGVYVILIQGNALLIDWMRRPKPRRIDPKCDPYSVRLDGHSAQMISWIRISLYLVS